MLKMRLLHFLRDDRGGYTVWSLIWFMLYLAIGGLAVDVSNAYRLKTGLQATADAAALAGVMALPDEGAAVDQALWLANVNMATNFEGEVLRAVDVTPGTWDTAAASFAPGGADPNAVRVFTRRGESNDNPVAMSLLRIVSLIGIKPWWNIATEAIALRYIPACIGQGLIARQRVRIASNNDFVNEICIHGQEDGVKIQNHNSFEPGVFVSMGDLNDLQGRIEPNPGLAEALREGDVFPKDVDRLEAIIEGLIPGHDNAYTTLPDYMYTSGEGGLRIPPTYVEVGDKFSGPLLPQHVYYVACANGNGQFSLPKANEQAVLRQVVVVSECRIHGNNMGQVEDVVLASYATGNGSDPLASAAIQLSAKADVGTPEGCAAGHGIDLYAIASVKLAAQGNINGLRAVVGGDFEMTANGEGANGVAVEAGHDISLTSNNIVGSCVGNSGGPYAQHYRLVR